MRAKPHHLEDAGIFLARLEAKEEAGALADLAAFEQSLDELYALPDVDADESLQIMTIHKAKGLQFGTVLLPGLDRAPGRGDPPLFLWKTRAAGRLLLAPIKETGEKKEPVYDYLNSLERTAEDAESGRLLYVATTRAKHRLHLLGCVKLDEAGQPKRPSKGSLLRKAWAVAEPGFARVEPPAASSAPRTVEPPPCELRRLAAGVQLPSPLPAADWKGRDEEAALTEVEFSWVGETARHVGSVVHRWLQRMAEDGLRDWTPQRVRQMHSQLARDLQRRGVAAAESEAAAERAAVAISNTLEDERGRWLLGPRERKQKSEMRLRTARDGRLRTLIIDRTFFEDGVRWIVDYKTSSHEGAELEKFLESERERYAPQLARYAEGARRRQARALFPHAARMEGME